MVAFTTLCGLCEPIDLVSTLGIPTAWMTARTGPPAMTPVPSGAGFNSTMPAAETAQHRMRDRGFEHVDLAQILLRRFDALLDGGRDFLGLPGAEADDLSAGIADHDQSREAHVLAALDDFGHAVDGDDLLLQVEIAADRLALIV